MKKKFMLIALCLCSVLANAFNYTLRHAMIPMRDGVSLYTEISEPADSPPGGSPVLLIRTPYSLAPYGRDEFRPADLGLDSVYLIHNYIIVKQNVRGRYLSEGNYEQVRPFNAHKKGNETDEATDAYDTVDWILHNCATNGNVGVKGTSYPGFYATMATMSNHPAIKATSPQAPICDWFLGDDIHHNGVLFVFDACSFGSTFFRPRRHPTTHGIKPSTTIDTTAEKYFKRPLSQVLTPYYEQDSFWDEVINHPDYDTFWLNRRATSGMKHIKPAVMIVGGLYDAEDCYGAWATYRDMKKVSPQADIFLVEGPWYHHAWADSEYQNLDGAYFGTGSARYFIEEIEYPFFAYYLEGKGHKPAPVMLLPSSETAPQTMKNQTSDSLWETLECWPPSRMKYVKAYLAGGTIVSDPQSPVPYYHEINGTKRNRNYMAADQRFASQRGDVLLFASEVLQDTLRLLGPVGVSLELNTTATDLNVVVKLIDLRPDGYQLLIRGDVMPSRYRYSYSSPQAISPGKDFIITFNMPDIAHYLLPGHCLMVQVQYSWYPLTPINPQIYQPNPYKGPLSDSRPAFIRLKAGRHTYLSLPITPSHGHNVAMKSYKLDIWN